MDENNIQQLGIAPTKTKSPVLIVLFSVLLLLNGILSILVTLPALLLGGILFGGLVLITGIAKIIAAISLRKMKKWSIYLISVMTAVGILLLVYGLIHKIAGLNDYLSNLLNVVVLAYICSIKNKFVS